MPLLSNNRPRRKRCVYSSELVPLENPRGSSNASGEPEESPEEDTGSEDENQ